MTALRRWSPAVVVLIFIGAVSPITTSGQELLDGTRIRVRSSQSTEPGGQWIEGTVVRFAPDTLWYRSDGSVSSISLDAAEIQRATYRDHRWRGLVVGAATGGAVGALVAYSSFEPHFAAYEDFFGCFASRDIFSAACGPGGQVNSRAEATAGGAVGGVLLGGTLGFFVGKMLGRWETVELDQIVIGDGNVSVSLRIRR